MDDDVEDFLFCFVNKSDLLTLKLSGNSSRSFFSLQCVGLTTGGRRPPAVSQHQKKKNISQE